MASLKLLIPFCFIIHSVLSAQLMVIKAPTSNSIDESPAKPMAFVHQSGASVTVVQSNLPINQQNQLAKQFAQIYNTYSQPLDQATQFNSLLSGIFNQYNNQVVVDFKAASIVQKYYLELLVNNNQYVLAWGC